MTDKNTKALARPLPRYETMKRRAQIMRILEGSKDNPTYEELTERMLDIVWVNNRWPDYSSDMARRDISYVLSLNNDDLRQLSSLYFSRQVGIIDDVIQELRGISVDPDVKPHTRIAALAAIGPYLDKEIRMFSNFGANKLNINKTNIDLDLDRFMEIKQKARKIAEEEEANIIDVDPKDITNTTDSKSEDQ